MTKEMSIEFDRWLSNYCRVNKVGPTWAEMTAKVKAMLAEEKKER